MNCKIEDCQKATLAKNYCVTHYHRLRRYGDPNYTKYNKSGETPYYKTPEFNVWTSMRFRCRTTRNNDYSKYKARGIKVCERWQGKHGFLNFINDMGYRPTPKHSIDRINNDGDYEPENCQWATATQQANNRRNNTGLWEGKSKLLINRK